MSHSDQQLIRYLLGVLPDDEAQRLDEMSVADDEFALRLQAAENDLVDSYARGELSGETLEQFKSFHLRSPLRREKLIFAETLHARELKTVQAAAAVQAQISADARASSQQRSSWRIFSVPRLTLQWGFAAASLAMALLAGFLFLELGQLKRQIAESGSERAALDQRDQELEKQLREQHAANTQIQSELERLRNETPHLATMKSIAILLMPQTRGTGQPVAISVPAAVDTLPVRLELESDEFPEYQVVLKDPAADRSIWRSANLKAESEGKKNKSLSVSISAKVLKQQTYVMEVTGIRRKGAPEFVGSYVFRVVLD